MYVVPAYQPGVTLFCDDGTSVRYPTLKAALKALGFRWIRRNVGEDFRISQAVRRGYTYGCYPYQIYEDVRLDWCRYVMRDDLGNKITATHFEPLRERKDREYRYRGNYRFWNGYGAAPGTGKRNAGCHTFRRIRHMSERRATEHFPEEGEVPPRAKRNTKHLPNPWDDQFVSARDDNGWKRFRKTQWRAKKK